MLKPYFCNDAHWDAFKKECLSWQGTPYRHYQKAKGYGADCTMFIATVLQEIGVFTKIEYEYYSKDWHTHTDKSIVEDSIKCNRKNVAGPFIFRQLLNTRQDWVRGDFLLIATVKNSNICNHAAVMWDDGERMYHSVNCRGVSFAYYVSWWQKRTLYKFRLFEEV